MADKKPDGRGVVDSIARLRELRYMTRGPGAKPVPKPSIDQLRADVAKVVAKKPKARKAKKKGRR
jgi:hypothetical protein